MPPGEEVVVDDTVLVGGFVLVSKLELTELEVVVADGVLVVELETVLKVEMLVFVLDVVKVVPVPLTPSATSVTLTQNLFGSFANCFFSTQ